MYPLKILYRDRTFLLLSLLLLASGIFCWWFIIVKIPKNADQFFLHYNIIFGVDLAGTYQKLLLLPGSVTAVVVINCLGAWFLYKKSRVLAKLLLVGGVAAVFFGMYAIIQVVGLNV